MLLDITFFDDAVPTSSVSQPSGAEVAAAALAGAEDEDEEHGKDVTDWASMIGRLKVKLTRAIPYRYIVHRLALILLVLVLHCGCATGRALDLRSTGRGFKSYSGQKLHKNLRQVVHTYVPLSPSSITWYRPRFDDALWLGR